MAAEITVLYFAWLRERMGTGLQLLTLPDGVDRVDRLIDHLAAHAPAGAFDRRDAIRCAVNQAIADPATPIAAGDEVALFPPMTGG